MLISIQQNDEVHAGHLTCQEWSVNYDSIFYILTINTCCFPPSSLISTVWSGLMPGRQLTAVVQGEVGDFLEMDRSFLQSCCCLPQASGDPELCSSTHSCPESSPPASTLPAREAPAPCTSPPHGICSLPLGLLQLRLGN